MERIYRSFEELPSVLTAVELASYLGISQSGAYNLLHSEGFPTLLVGKRMMVQKENFRDWLENHNDTGLIF